MPSPESKDPIEFGRFRSWPITSARALEPQLREMGLRVAASAIDGTGGASSGPALSDALVSVGAAGRGGTGSFVSDDGLIITNWHVAHDAVRQASLSAGRDYIEEGFVARTRAEEISGPNYEVWITRSCVDVSDAVLEVVKSEPDALLRANKVRDCTQAIASKAEASAKEGAGGVRCDVQEMVPNESYVLFTYARFVDVRIVYVPPRSLGNFGGDADNFEWPRHTADFTLLRAYVAPDGGAAPYAEANIPYKPASWLRVCRDGGEEGDFVFLLGFPGHTMRYAPTARLKFSDEMAVPALLRDFHRKLALISEHESHSDSARLKLAGGKKSLANEYKRSAGKRVMMRKLGLLAERTAEESALCSAVPDAAPILARLAAIYDDLGAASAVNEAQELLRGAYFGSALLGAGHAIHEWSVEAAKPDAEREAAYRDRNLPFLVQRLSKRLSEIHEPFEVALIVDARQAVDTSAADPVEGRTSVWHDALRDDAAIAEAVERSRLRSVEAESLLRDESLRDDPFVRAAEQLYTAYVRQRDSDRALLSERDELLAKLLDLQRRSGGTFHPDCNGSLRLSAGHIEGYAPADAVTHAPRTTLEGLLDKTTEAAVLGVKSSAENEFDCPERLMAILAADAAARKTPVCVLYSTDTVGGNSGSPVLNADGEFVGINFDRQRQGLMNEFKYSRSYSRSIGVDVRYILWLVGQYDGAQTLVEEMLRRG